MFIRPRDGRSDDTPFMRAEFERLRALVPKTAPSLIAENSAKIDCHRRRIIQNSRLVTLYPYLPHVPDELLSYFASRDRLSNLFRPVDQGTFTGVSQLSQNASFLVTYLLENPSIFARAVCERIKHLDFELIVRTSVPSFFGFFSSGEQLDNARAFYEEVGRIAVPELAVRIMDPFFNSAATFRFLEHALDRFFQTFLLDYAVTPETERIAMIPYHGVYLLQCFTTAVPLLPRQHLALLHSLRARQWPPGCVADLFFVRFLWPGTIRWLKNSAHDAQLPCLERVLVSVADHKAEIAELWKAIYTKNSMCEVPNLFRPFDHSHLLYHLCVNDIILIAGMLNDQGKLPKSTTYAEFGDVDKHYQFNWFWCQVFPRVPPQSERRENLIFTNQPTVAQFAGDPEFPKLRDDFQKVLRLATSFETFLEQSRNFRRLHDWDSLIQTQANQLMVGDIEYLALQDLKLPHEVKQLVVIAGIDQNLLRRHQGQMAEFAQTWNERMAQWKAGNKLQRMLKGHNSARKVVWQGIRMIRCIAKAKFDRTFRIYISTIMLFQEIGALLGNGKELLCTILCELPGEVVLVPFIVYGGTVVKLRNFLSEAETNAWVTLEQCILMMLKDEPVLMVQIISEQIEIRSAHVQGSANG